MHRRNAYHAFRTFKFGMRDVGNAYYAFRAMRCVKYDMADDCLFFDAPEEGTHEMRSLLLDCG